MLCNIVRFCPEICRTDQWDEAVRPAGSLASWLKHGHTSGFGDAETRWTIKTPFQCNQSSRNCLYRYNNTFTGQSNLMTLSAAMEEEDLVLSLMPGLWEKVYDQSWLKHGCSPVCYFQAVEPDFQQQWGGRSAVVSANSIEEIMESVAASR